MYDIIKIVIYFINSIYHKTFLHYTLNYTYDIVKNLYLYLHVKQGGILMFNLSRQDDKFFVLLNKDARLTNEAAKLLAKCFDEINDNESMIKQIKEMEHNGDQIVHEIIKEINMTFITPLEKEDIYSIAKEMDDILDYIETSASRISMFNIHTTYDKAKELCKMIIDSTEELKRVLELLSAANKTEELLKAVIEVNRIEEEGDAISRNAVKELFTSELPDIEIVKWREVYHHLENALDACESVANLIEGIVTKNV